MLLNLSCSNIGHSLIEYLSINYYNKANNTSLDPGLKLAMFHEGQREKTNSELTSS